MLINEYEVIEAYSTIKAELLKFSEEIRAKREVLCLTKIDAMSEEEIARFQKVLEEETQRKVLPISSVSGRNIELLKEGMT